MCRMTSAMPGVLRLPSQPQADCRTTCFRRIVYVAKSAYWSSAPVGILPRPIAAVFPQYGPSGVPASIAAVLPQYHQFVCRFTGLSLAFIIVTATVLLLN